MRAATITPADLIHHMLTAGTTGERVLFVGLLIVLAVWALVIGQAVAEAVADTRRAMRRRRIRTARPVPVTEPRDDSGRFYGHGSTPYGSETFAVKPLDFV